MSDSAANVPQEVFDVRRWPRRRSWLQRNEPEMFRTQRFFKAHGLEIGALGSMSGYGLGVRLEYSGI